MLDQVPAEILRQVVRSLKPRDLKCLRLTNKTVATQVTPTLFRKIRFNILTLDRLYDVTDSPKFSQYVEELSYYELGLSGLSLDHRNNGLRQLTDTMVEFISMSRIPNFSRRWREILHLHNTYVTPFLAEDWDVPLAPTEGEGYAASHDLSLARVVMERGLDAILDIYADKATLEKSNILYLTCRSTLPRLPNLRRVVCTETVNNFTVNHLDFGDFRGVDDVKELLDLFPITDAALRTVLQMNTVTAWPARGFLDICQAMGHPSCNHNIQHLEVRPDRHVLVDRGLNLDMIDMDLGRQISDSVWAGAFRNLTSLTLCLEVKRRTRSYPRIDRHPQAYRLLKALSKASKLRDLKICLGPAAKNITSSADVLPGWPPRVKFPELRSISFEMMHFTTTQLAQFLVNQQGLERLALKHITLAGHWSSLFRKLSRRKDFVLDSIHLHDFSQDGCESFEFTCEKIGGKVQLSQKELLDYINLGVNPLPLRLMGDENTSPGQEVDLLDFPEMSELDLEETHSPRQDSYGHEYDPEFGAYAEDSDLDMDDTADEYADDDDSDDSDEMDMT
ncbi:hypothetical protein LTS15_007095 [Exophiala xenobiotica]|nr:hypothetical protein LTS15_007095 [Exophiala xenobiotica]